MSTTHSRIPAILLPGDGGPGEGGDDAIDVTAHISNNLSLLANLVGAVRFTTAAGKPTSNNYDGKVAFEIDTSNLFFWDGDSWEILPGFIFRCTAATRPTTGQYAGMLTGQVIYETDTKRWLHYDGSSWYDVAGGGVRNYRLDIASVSLTNGQSWGTIVIPAQPRACRVIVTSGLQIGFTGGATPADMGVEVTAIVGTFISHSWNGSVDIRTTAKWFPYTASGFIDLAAGQTTTLTFSCISSAGNCYARGAVDARIVFAGEY